MNIKTRFNWIGNDWKRVKNHCRTTMAKKFTEKDPSDTFKKAMLICEHSPIRCLDFDWTWEEMPYWCHAEWTRHKFEKFISTQRDDRVQNEIPRGKKPQDSPVTYDGYANMQNLIDAWRKRLCFQASKEAREYAESFKQELQKTNPYEANVLVPNCIYRCGCPEFEACGFFNKFWEYFMKNHPDMNIFDIQQRYDVYNEMFNKRMN